MRRYPGAQRALVRIRPRAEEVRPPCPRTIGSPDDLTRLDPAELRPLAQEIRNFLVTSVARTGGHLAPNLGAVELTIALHRVFDFSARPIPWDTGHQAYVHKILTGRQGGFTTLRQQGGLSGYPSRAESEHDIIENSHASTPCRMRTAWPRAWELQGLLSRRHVVAVVGDGSLTGGMAGGAQQHLRGKNRPLIIVVNDNERSYSPTIGGLANHLATLRVTRGYERFLEWGKQVLGRTPVVGQPLYDTLHGVKKGLKDIVAPQGLFEDLGLKYLGPVDGHDVAAMETAFRQAKQYAGPVIVHCITAKGLGYRPAEGDEADRFHTVSVIDPVSGQPTSTAPGIGRPSSPTRSSRLPASATTWSASPRRCCIRSGWLPWRVCTRSVCSTSASRSSTP